MRARRSSWFWGLGLAVSLACVAAAPAGDKTLRSGIDRANFDDAVKPGDDFFQYVNGNWIRRNPMPAEFSRWGSFSQLHDDNLLALKEIVEGLAKQTGPLDENRRKIRDLYATAMDEAKLDKLGAAPLKEELNRIAKLETPHDLVSE